MADFETARAAYNKSKQRGVYIRVIKGKHAGRIGTVSRVVNHAWYQILLLPADPVLLHTSYFVPATPVEMLKAMP